MIRAVRLASAAALTLCASAASAQDDEASFGGGAFVGYRFGTGSHFEWGVEAFATRVYQESFCTTTERRTGVGGFAQLAFLGLESPRLTLGAHAGGELERGVASLTGELGLTYRFGPDGGLGIHTGFVAESGLFLYAAARYQWLLNEAWLGVGGRMLDTYGMPSFCSVGRPLRTGAGMLALHASPQASTYAANAGPRIEAVGRAYERDAQLEHASIPAFLQLAAELAALQAPRALITRAIDAARDEVRHAALCTRIAERHLQACAPPALPALVQRAPIAGPEGIERLAIESWLDGCLSEGRAAAHAARAAELATDPEARSVQHAIARDEQRHAELAWSILEWSLQRGGERTHAALHALRDVEGTVAHDAAAHEALEAHGLLGARHSREVAARHFETSQRRLQQVLAAR